MTEITGLLSSFGKTSSQAELAACDNTVMMRKFAEGDKNTHA